MGVIAPWICVHLTLAPQSTQILLLSLLIASEFTTICTTPLHFATLSSLPPCSCFTFCFVYSFVSLWTTVIQSMSIVHNKIQVQMNCCLFERTFGFVLRGSEITAGKSNICKVIIIFEMQLRLNSTNKILLLINLFFWNI
jgi:hypothetical protein